MERLKNLRLSKNFTQKQVANFLGCNQTAIGKYERGELEPNISLLLKLSDIFDCSIDYLVGRTDEIEVRSSEGHSLTKNESELLKLFNLLDEVKQNKVIGYCYALAN